MGWTGSSDRKVQGLMKKYMTRPTGSAAHGRFPTFDGIQWHVPSTACNFLHTQNALPAQVCSPLTSQQMLQWPSAFLWHVLLFILSTCYLNILWGKLLRAHKNGTMCHWTPTVFALAQIPQSIFCFILHICSPIYPPINPSYIFFHFRGNNRH